MYILAEAAPPDPPLLHDGCAKRNLIYNLQDKKWEIYQTGIREIFDFWIVMRKHVWLM